MKFEFLVAKRYLKAKKNLRFISFTTGLAVFGIAIGVMALIVVLAVMNGFQDDIKNKILGTQSHIIVSHYLGGLSQPDAIIATVRKDPEVVGASPFVLSQGMVSAPGGVKGVVIRGIDPISAPQVISIKDVLVKGSFENLGDFGVLLGSELAVELGVSIGDQINIISPSGTLTPIGMIPKSMGVVVKGLFSTGMYEYDSNMVYMSLNAAMKMFMQENPSGIEVKVKDIYRADIVAKRIVKALGPGYWARTWRDLNKSLFSALKLEKTVMFIILTFIVLVAAFNIVGTLIMLVMEKRKEIAILKSMGATSPQILRIFMLHGLFIGATGTLLGLVLGLVLAYNLSPVISVVEMVFRIEVMPKDVYYITGMPSKVEFLDVLVITIASLALSFFAAIYPARQAAKQDPVEVIRYEG